jgi:hypothetical protein
MDVAASEFYDHKDKTYDLNFKEEVIHALYICVCVCIMFFFSYSDSLHFE